MHNVLSARTYVARALQQVETELNDNVILISKDLRDPASNPPEAENCQQNKGYSSLRPGEETLTSS